MHLRPGVCCVLNVIAKLTPYTSLKSDMLNVQVFGSWAFPEVPLPFQIRTQYQNLGAFSKLQNKLPEV